MKKLLILLAIIIVGFSVFFIFLNYDNSSFSGIVGKKTSTTQTQKTNSETSVIVQGLDTPWSIVFLPDSSILVSERSGTVRLVDSSNNLVEQPAAVISEVSEIGEGGLLGITLHPNFVDNQYVYLYYTYNGNTDATLNRVVRMRFANGSLSDSSIILDSIPGAPNHNGGRIKFGPDNALYIATGDAQEPSFAQNTSSLAGKILRVTDSGQPFPGNPFGNEVFSYGHRNVQGLAWDSQGNLWATEHGRSGVQSGLDEINLIKPGSNYGWPEIEGDETRSGMVGPVKNSGALTTWAPSGIAAMSDTLVFGGLRGQSIYTTLIQNLSLDDVSEHFKEEYGRIRDVVLGPDGMLYIATSNRDGRGIPSELDDRIIRINPQDL